MAGRTLCLDGDLLQLGAMGRELREAGFDVRQCGVRPVVHEKPERTIGDALHFLWREKPEGWWNMSTQLIDFGVCTSDEYFAALDIAAMMKPNG